MTLSLVIPAILGGFYLLTYPFKTRYYSKLYRSAVAMNDRMEIIKKEMMKEEDENPPTIYNRFFRIGYGMGYCNGRIIVVVEQSILAYLYWGNGMNFITTFEHE